MLKSEKTKKAMLPIEVLKTLQDKPDSGIFKVREEIHVTLYPKYLLNIRIGIINYLNGQINQWHPKLNGILAAYESLKLFHSTGTLANEEAHIHLDVIGDFWLFRPKVGSHLRGVVTKKSPSHLSCLVHGVFNVPCYKPDHLEAKDDWFGTNIPVGKTVRFSIAKTDMSQRIPFILGRLNDDKYSDDADPLVSTIEEVQGSNDWTDEQTTTTKSTEESFEPESRKRKKNKRSDLNSTSDSESKKKPKHVATDSDFDKESEDGFQKEKRKKKKKSKSRSEESPELKEELETSKNLSNEEYFENNQKKSSKKSKKKSRDRLSNEAEVEAQRDLLLQSLQLKAVSGKKKKKDKRELEKPVEESSPRTSKKKKSLPLNDRSLGDPPPSFLVPTSTPKEKVPQSASNGMFEDPRQSLIGNMLSKFQLKKSRKST